MTTWQHTLTGRTFAATDGPSRSYGPAARDGRWDTGQAGTIWPAETFADGTPAWSSAGLGDCPSTADGLECGLNPNHGGRHVAVASATATGASGWVKDWPAA